MKKLISCRKCFMVVLLASVFPLDVLASLGGSVDSVAADGSHMKANANVTQTSNYSVHEIKSPTGTVVREYVSQSGQVFGASWSGPFIPNMRQILGIYFEKYSSAARAQRESRPSRQPLFIKQPGLVLESVGHMRAYSGKAYDPALLPSGVEPNDIR